MLRNGDNSLSDVSCDEKASAAFFCEMKSGETTCVPREQRCDKLSQCVDNSDELKCSDTVNVGNVYHNTLLPPAVVDFTGKGSFTVTPLNSSTCPETHFQCHGNGYCMPVYVRCNGVFDCRGKEDEMDCDSYTCPGFYRCRASKICLHHDHLCDGVFQCPQRDDELLCNFTCPENCTCYGHAFICTGEFRANHYRDLRYLEAPDTKLKLTDVFNNRLLINLVLRNSGITRVGELNLPNLQSLDLSYNKLTSITGSELAVLPAQLDPSDCHAPKDEISSCDALLRSEVFRLFLALYALLALLGNLGSFFYRVFIDKASVKLGFNVFVTHLCVADFLMGAYLAIVGVADRIYDGDYRWNDSEWKHSAACKVAGFLSLLSSEVSAFLICLITLERFLVIGFPHKTLRFSRWSAHVACVTLWILGLLLAAVPLLPNTAHWQFYSQSGICIPLPVTRKEFPGGDYAFGIMIALNFVLFLFIAAGQILIYWSIRSNSVTTNRYNKKSKDMAVARRLLAVVMTDFLCWFPIGLLGILARSGVPIPGDVNVAMAIFVLPFNSALNPFLYTFNMLRERRRKAREDRLAMEERSEHATTQNSVQSSGAVTSSQQKAYTEKEAWKLFDKFLKEGVLSLDRVRHRILNVELTQSQ
ncbi:G-protein coupled receptor GRL101-like [Littorina saxatilis]|uniref:G-protein coupled receptor GRL101-like n=1 Tax=Littorina saxatilis TaxID=31220 RepID=UPI0038B69C87